MVDGFRADKVLRTLCTWTRRWVVMRECMARYYIDDHLLCKCIMFSFRRSLDKALIKTNANIHCQCQSVHDLLIELGSVEAK